MTLSPNTGQAAAGPACKGLDPEQFFPKPWQLTPVTAPPSTVERQALRVCVQCPVREECLDRDLEECTAPSQVVGVRGGLRQSDRRALYVKRYGHRARNGADQ
ncbi:WhiB family transcriptional regulator [Streptomyces sp. ND04-05B]|uniref:WhiB family transcriptional regulator n=1 Tax=Streptomyces sp. ND04-05B TaxID=3028693 RepID=UPI0029AE1D47|nr:WhiB family transcriptional regulator [Streptomyces sp. ND04-05B]MDX3064005.1 WhiB family transcriptional regulator [Streptomyces sp. ND04-05B]